MSVFSELGEALNVGHPLRQGAYEGAENLSTCGDFAEVGEESLFK